MGIATVGLKFGVLGPLEASCGGDPIRLGGERQRALLAVLLVHTGELVTTDLLVEQLFGEERSATAVNAVQVAVSRLRRVLEGCGGGQVVQTRPGGYVLSAEPDQLDVSRFERLLGEGRQLLAGGNGAGASERLREALALWRGPPLADLASLECLQAEIRRLEELRLGALMDRIDADLELGSDAEMIAELDVLVASNPLQERLRGQLMLALYRAGRQADALAVYRQTSELLRDELGLEPARALQQLERSILHHDATLDPMSPAALAPKTNLPVSATPFLGRTEELTEVTALLERADTRLVTMTGAGGSGKTRLALRCAEMLVHRYRDGVWFVGLADITDVQLITPTICRTLGLAERPGLTPLQRLGSWLKDRQLLLVLDNLEQLVADATELGELLNQCPGLVLLATSREPLHLAREYQFEVPALAEPDAIELLITRTSAVAPGLNVDSDLAKQICERLDCLPLAIELAAARTKALSPTEILGRLDSSLPLLTGGPRDAPQRQRTLRATIDWSHELLNADQQRQFARLSVFAGGCTLTAAETICDAELDTLQALVDRSLIRHSDDRYWMLETLREYAHERLEQNGDEEELRQAHATWFVELLRGEGLPQPGWPTEKSLARVMPERENFAAALEWASSSGMLETVARLAAPLVGVWVVTGQLYEAQRWMTLVLEHEDAYAGLLAAEVVSAARALAWNRGDHIEAAGLTERALGLWRKVGNLEAIGREMVSLGMVACEAGDLTRGRIAFEKAARFAREHALTDVLTVALTDLGDLEILEGDLDAARSLCEESRAMAAPGSDGAVISDINLAHVAMLQGRPTDAASVSRQALEATLRAGSMLKVAWSAIMAAWPLAELGEFERSAQLLGSGLAFLDSSGAKREWTDEACEAAVCKILRDKFDDHSTQALLDEGRQVPLERAAREALNGSSALDDAQQLRPSSP